MNMNLNCITSKNHDMKPAQRILFAARHAFLKQGFVSTTLQKIAVYAGVSPNMIRYHFGSKENLFNIIFLDFIDLLIEQLKRKDQDRFNMDFQKRKIEYPDVYEVAWFVAHEFHSNGDNIYRLLKNHKKIVDQLRTIYHDPRPRENFEKLIRINVSMIMERNMLRL